MNRHFTVVDCEQRSEAWFKARLGRVTGSVASDIMATLKSGGEPAARRDLRTRLALEKITGQSLEDDYENADMRRGRELEPEARAAYEAMTGEIVQETGFLSHTDLMIGCSLDGHLGDFQMIWECKAPRPANHLKYLQGGIVPAEHKYQLVHNLLVSGAASAEFCSYSNVFPEALRLFTARYKRNEAEIDSYRLILLQFLREIDSEIEQIQSLAARCAA